MPVDPSAVDCPLLKTLGAELSRKDFEFETAAALACFVEESAAVAAEVEVVGTEAVVDVTDHPSGSAAVDKMRMLRMNRLNNNRVANNSRTNNNYRPADNNRPEDRKNTVACS